LFKDHRAINSNEGRVNTKEKDVPKELLTDKNKHSTFILIHDYFGKKSRLNPQ